MQVTITGIVISEKSLIPSLVTVNQKEEGVKIKLQDMSPMSLLDRLIPGNLMVKGKDEAIDVKILIRNP